MIIQKLWKIGDSIVVTIPKEVRDKFPKLKAGAYVKMDVKENKIVLELVKIEEIEG